MKHKIIKIATVPISLDKLLEGQLAFIKPYYKVIAVSSPGETLIKVAHREGVAVVPIHMSRKITPLKDLVAVFKLYQLFKKEKPLIIHSITPKAGLLCMLAGYLARVPIRIHTFTGLIFPTKKGFLKLLLLTMDKWLCKLATNVYPEGKGVKNDLISYGVTNKALKVLANGNVNGINISYFNPENFSKHELNTLKKSLAIPQKSVVFIFIGRLVGDKGINELVAAFKKLQTKFPSREPEERLSNQKLGEYKENVQQNSPLLRGVRGVSFNNYKLLLVGPLETALDPLKKETLHEINTNKNVISVGWQHDVRPYLAISNCLVFPSYREGFPNVVMQAGAMELPSIVTNINGCNEIIEHGTNGLIIPPKDETALLQAMKKLLLDATLRKSLATNARPMITARYEQKMVWEAILAEYKRLEQEIKFAN